MKVSIIVPVYNTKDYLKQCLDSLVAQTLEDLEILVVDDGSTDGSTEIVREFSERYPERLKAYFKENILDLLTAMIGLTPACMKLC